MFYQKCGQNQKSELRLLGIIRLWPQLQAKINDFCVPVWLDLDETVKGRSDPSHIIFECRKEADRKYNDSEIEWRISEST